MALPQFSMRDLIEAGVHFGHKTKRWNPRMEPFLYGVRNDIHIIDLQKTVPMLHRAIKAVRDISANNGRVLFVGTKRQASDIVVEAAARCGQYYVNNRWLGGMLTNWKTIQNSIKHLKKLEEQLAIENSGFTKKERLSMERQREKLEKSLGGIRDMSGLPDVVFIIDTLREDLAIAEAKKLGIPIVAIVDSNASVDGIDYPIPGNDDAIRAIRLYCQLISDAVLDGIQDSFSMVEETVAEQAPVKEIAVANEEVASEEDKESSRKTKSTTKKEAFAEVAKKAQSKKKESAEVAIDDTTAVDDTSQEEAAKEEVSEEKQSANAS